MTTQELIWQEANNYSNKKSINGVDAKIVKRDFIEGATFGASLRDAEILSKDKEIAELKGTINNLLTKELIQRKEDFNNPYPVGKQ